MGEWPRNCETEESSPERVPVLVAIVNNQRDFDIAREQGWYRIPAKHVPRRLGAEYLAFYQTKIFGEERWAVSYYAAVRRVHLVERRSLLPEERDHPRAGDWYYKIEIGPLLHLPHPIPSRRLRRITFIPTTLARLLSAWELNDLWLGSEEEERLWEAFKQNEIVVERRLAVGEGDETYLLDFAAFCEQGPVAILCGGQQPAMRGNALREHPRSDYELAAGGWRVLHLSSERMEASLGGCLSAVREAIAQAGGLMNTREYIPVPEVNSPCTEDW